MLDEGERDKVIQQNNPKTIENDAPETSQPTQITPELPSPKSVPDPPPKPCRICDVLPEPEPNTRRGMRARLPAGIYKTMNDGTNDTAALTFAEAFMCEINTDPPGSETDPDNMILPDDVANNKLLDPLFALAGSMGTEPASINEALRGPDNIAWNTALKYEISQLEKLHIW